MKKVESVDQTSDEKATWKAKVFLSRRAWDATITEQVPDSHIVWRSSGEKGHVDGAVTFTSLGPNLTKVCLVLEYYPKGLFEHTGNIWRAQGRRARLEFQHFKRHAMVNVLVRQDEVEGWRGEIRDSEVVKTHEEALEEEGRAEETGDQEAGERARGAGCPRTPAASTTTSRRATSTTTSTRTRSRPTTSEDDEPAAEDEDEEPAAEDDEYEDEPADEAADEAR